MQSLKSLIAIPDDWQTEQSSDSPKFSDIIPAYAQYGVQLRTTSNSGDALEDKAINVASRAMDSPDPKLALDAAKAAMSWLGKGSKGKTTIIADNAQINQINSDDRSKDNILQALLEISRITGNSQ